MDKEQVLDRLIEAMKTEEYLTIKLRNGTAMYKVKILSVSKHSYTYMRYQGNPTYGELQDIVDMYDYRHSSKTVIVQSSDGVEELLWCVLNDYLCKEQEKYAEFVNGILDIARVFDINPYELDKLNLLPQAK